MYQSLVTRLPQAVSVYDSEMGLKLKIVNLAIFYKPLLQIMPCLGNGFAIDIACRAYSYLLISV